HPVQTQMRMREFFPSPPGSGRIFQVAPVAANWRSPLDSVTPIALMAAKRLGLLQSSSPLALFSDLFRISTFGFRISPLDGALKMLTQGQCGVVQVPALLPESIMDQIL